MIRGTTPTISMKIKDDRIDLRLAKNLYFTMEQNPSVSVTKTGDDIVLQDGQTALIYLSQDDTMLFNPGVKTEIQLNWTYVDVDGLSRRAATKPKEIHIDKNLLRRVIS